MSEDDTYVQVTATNANTLTATVADSGGTSGSDGAYIPAYAVTSVVQTSGELTSVTLDNPNTGNPILHSIVTYAQKDGDGQTITPVTFTVPTGVSGGAGGYDAKETSQPPIVSVLGMDGSGTSTTISAGVSLNLSTNRNTISITGVDSFTIGIIFRLFFG